MMAENADTPVSSLSSRPFRLLEERGDEGEILLRAVFEHDPQAPYYLDPDYSVTIHRPDGQIVALMYSDQSFYFKPRPERFMSEGARLAEAELHGRSGRYDRRYENREED